MKVPGDPVSLVGAETKGSLTAKFVLMEFSDFQCPFCGRFARETLSQIDRDYVASGMLRVAFRHLPLNGHALAQPAAEAAHCAGRQGQFWQMHDLLFQVPPRLDDASIRHYARSMNLDNARFNSCLTDAISVAQVQADAALARNLGVGGTPAFLLGEAITDGRMKGIEWIGGSLPYAEFKKVLDRSVRKYATRW